MSDYDDVNVFFEIDLVEYAKADETAVWMNDPSRHHEGQRVWMGDRAGPYRLGVVTHIEDGFAFLETIVPPVWYEGEPPEIHPFGGQEAP